MHNSNCVFTSKFLILFSFLFTVTSCLHDPECNYSHRLNVKVNSTKEIVKLISLYVFDGDDLLYEIIDQKVDKNSANASFILDHLPQGKYTYIAWGNLYENQEKPVDGVGVLKLKDANVFLKENESSSHLSPDELFYGSLRSTKRMYEKKSEVMYISRYISGVTIKVYNPLGYFSKNDTNFSIKLKGTVSTIPFDNDWIKSGVTNTEGKDSIGVYAPAIEWKDDNNLMQINRFYTLPSDPNKPVYLDVYYGEVLLQSFLYNNYLRMNKVTDITLNLWNEDADQWFNYNDWSNIDQSEDL